MKKLLFSAAVSFTLAFAFGLSACQSGEGGESGTDNGQSAAHVHSWALSESAEATCGEAAREYYTCECGSVKTVRKGAATGEHVFDEDGVCTVCGYADMSGMTQSEAISRFGFYVIDEDGSGTYSTGDIVFYGSYPQKLINTGDLDGSEGAAEYDADTRSLLDTLSEYEGKLPAADDSGDWTSYGYYSENEVSDYMFYRDVELNGSKYRGVYLLNYRSYYAKLKADAQYSYIDDEGYALNKVYWFEYEPIRWIVLDYVGGKLLINSLECLEAQPYQDIYEYDAESKLAYIPSTRTYINDWEACSLRGYLNGSFADLAFNDFEKSLICTASLDNRTTGYAEDAAYQIIQNDTEDRVFVLSWQDLTEPDYGYPETENYDDAIQKTANGSGADDEEFAQSKSRRRSYTAYSLIQGLHSSSTGHTASGDGACRYVVRSAGIYSYSICGVSKYGSVMNSGILNLNGTDSYDSFAVNGNLGISPALYLKAGK